MERIHCEVSPFFSAQARTILLSPLRGFAIFCHYTLFAPFQVAAEDGDVDKKIRRRPALLKHPRNRRFLRFRV